ncbi:alanine racemase [Rugosimonospora africana]|uniref:Alanine racemase n=1 Tax=Rugosimonospora africana TaxID=556532 RepID=A0A8J3VSL3_9ACTN|nr:alanine racemase [Rugosimonospora africana]GIH17412.1 alanine racemase [Rugosimonospora africana]
MSRTEAVVDLSAIEANVARLAAATFAEQTRARVMAVVSGGGYGHGLLPSARAALAGGATWLGAATVDEALALRDAGITAPVFTWLWTPDDLARAIGSDIDLAVSGPDELRAVRAAANELGLMARIHLEVDTGLGHSGSGVADWPDLLDAAAKAQTEAELVVIGVWSQLAHADEPEHPANDAQLNAFHDALHHAALHGIVPEVRHLADSAGALALPGTHFDLVRAGTAVYGLSPVPHRGDLGLVPAMTLRSQVARVKRVGAGPGASGRAATLAVVPLGYADGIPRAAAGAASVAIDGARFPIRGPVGIDHFVVDVTGAPVSEGDIAVLFGPGRDGEPLAQDWAAATGTIHAEIVTGIGPRVPRSYRTDN